VPREVGVAGVIEGGGEGTSEPDVPVERAHGQQPGVAGPLTVSNSTVDYNLAIGGDGGSGGNGLGGGIYVDALSTLTLTGVTVEHNLAIGGAAGDGGCDGQGEGGGVYLTPGGIACADLLTVIRLNHASTTNVGPSATR
jgi:hypothetical protein